MKTKIKTPNSFAWWWLKCAREPDYYKAFVNMFEKECLQQREKYDKERRAEGYIDKICPKCGDSFFDHKDEKEIMCYEDRYYPEYTESWNLENAARREKEIQNIRNERINS